MKTNLIITKPDDRRQVAAILVENGYGVKKTTIKVGKYSKTALEVESREEAE